LQFLIWFLDRFIAPIKNAAWRGRVPFFDCLLLLYQSEIGNYDMFSKIIFGLNAST
jgi:hypothetical protein